MSTHSIIILLSRKHQLVSALLESMALYGGWYAWATTRKLMRTVFEFLLIYFFCKT